MRLPRSANPMAPWALVGLYFLNRGLLFYRIAALVLLLVVGHQDRADMRERIGDADFPVEEMQSCLEAAIRRELGPRRSA